MQFYDIPKFMRALSRPTLKFLTFSGKDGEYTTLLLTNRSRLQNYSMFLELIKTGYFVCFLIFCKVVNA